VVNGNVDIRTGRRLMLGPGCREDWRWWCPYPVRDFFCKGHRQIFTLWSPRQDE